MHYPIILPPGTQAIWQHAHSVDDAALWDEIAVTLLRDATNEPDAAIKDDLCLLSMVACDRANAADPAVAYSIELFDVREAA